MKTYVHFAVSAILAVIFYPLFKWNVLFILVGGVLIDIDHYLWYAYKYKKFNILESYKFYIKVMDANDFSKVTGMLCIFHTIEFLLLMALLSFYFKPALIFTIGMASHYLLDLLYLYVVPKRFILNHSLIWWLIENKKFANFK